ncbi:MAG: hypothetical protein WDN06_11100 [Asticcacaulis sp.]
MEIAAALQRHRRRRQSQLDPNWRRLAEWLSARFNIICNAMPLNGRLVMRLITEKEAKAK